MGYKSRMKKQNVSIVKQFHNDDKESFVQAIKDGLERLENNIITEILDFTSKILVIEKMTDCLNDEEFVEVLKSYNTFGDIKDTQMCRIMKREPKENVNIGRLITFSTFLDKNIEETLTFACVRVIYEDMGMGSFEDLMEESEKYISRLQYEVLKKLGVDFFKPYIEKHKEIVFSKNMYAEHEEMVKRLDEREAELKKNVEKETKANDVYDTVVGAYLQMRPLHTRFFKRKMTISFYDLHFKKFLNLHSQVVSEDSIKTMSILREYFEKDVLKELAQYKHEDNLMSLF